MSRRLRRGAQQVREARRQGNLRPVFELRGGARPLSYNKIYIGYTKDLISRFYSHNFYGTKGYTKKFRPWKVVWVEIYQEKSEAFRRERSLKSSRGRYFIYTEVIPSLGSWLGSYQSTD